MGNIGCSRGGHDGLADVKYQNVKVLLPVLAQVSVLRMEVLWFK